MAGLLEEAIVEGDVSADEVVEGDDEYEEEVEDNVDEFDFSHVQLNNRLLDNEEIRNPAFRSMMNVISKNGVNSNTLREEVQRERSLIRKRERTPSPVFRDDDSCESDNVAEQLSKLKTHPRYQLASSDEESEISSVRSFSSEAVDQQIRPRCKPFAGIQISRKKKKMKLLLPPAKIKYPKRQVPLFLSPMKRKKAIQYLAR